MKVHYFISQLRHFGFNEKLNQSFYDHSVCEEKTTVFIKPKKYDYTCISPFNFFSLKKKYNIKTVFLYDRVIGTNNKIIVSDHVNRSGFYPLRGKTPYKSLTMFPDMSKVYEVDPNQKKTTVHTIGPKRFKSKKLSDSLVYSEGAAAVSTLWHYLNVKVKCFGVPV